MAFACATGPPAPPPSARPRPAAAPAAGPSPSLASRRYGLEPPVVLSPVETRALEVAGPLLRRPGEPPPARSGALVLAARELAVLAAAGEAAPLGRARVRTALFNAAASDPAPLKYLISGPPDRVADALPPVIAPRSFAGHLGAGAVVRDGTAWLVLLASPRRATLRTFPRAVAVGDAAVLEGELVTGLAEPRLFVTAPDGTVRERAISGTRRFRAELTFDRPGRWTVEVLGRGLNGPEVLALLAVSAGDDVPDAAAAVDPPEPPDQGVAEARVLEAMNATRRRHGLPPLEPSAPLQAVARAHSADMLRLGLLAHQLPGSPGTVERLRRARIPYRQVLENVAKGETALAAHEEIEGSPAHRDNLLAAGPTLAGVGIARATLPGGGLVVYLTEVIVEPPGPGALGRAVAPRRAGPERDVVTR